MRLVKKQIVDLNERISYLLYSSKNAKDEIKKLQSMVEEHNLSREQESLLFNEQINNSLAYFSLDQSFLEPINDPQDSSVLVFNVRTCFM